MLIVRNAITATGISMVVFGVLGLLSGLFYPAFCFGGPGCAGGGILWPAFLLLAEAGVSWLTFSFTVTVLGFAVLQLGLKGRADLPVVSGLLAIAGSLLLIPTALICLVGTLIFLISNASCQGNWLCNPAIPLGLSLLGFASIITGYTGGTLTIQRLWSRRMLLGLVLEGVTSLLAILSFPFFLLQIALPSLELALFSLLFLTLDRYVYPSSQSSILTLTAKNRTPKASA